MHRIPHLEKRTGPRTAGEGGGCAMGPEEGHGAAGAPAATRQPMDDGVAPDDEDCGRKTKCQGALQKADFIPITSRSHPDHTPKSHEMRGKYNGKVPITFPFEIGGYASHKKNTVQTLS